VTDRSCSNCGHPLSPWARFCPNCGAATVDVPAPYEPPAVESPAEERVRWRAIEGIGIFIVSIIVTVLLTLPIGFALRPFAGCDGYAGIAHGTCLHHRDLFLAYSVGLNEVALLATVLFWIKVIHKSSPRALGFRRLTVQNIFIGIGVGIGGLFAAGIISLALQSIIRSFTHRPVEAPQQIPVQQSPGGAVLVIIGLSVIVLAPLAEEAFFRGFLLQGLRRWARPSIAILISAAVFGLAHLIPLIMLPIFGLGILLATIVEARGSLVPSIFAHATFNAVGFVQLFHAHIRFG
jgi:CAAX protease family protein